MDDLDLIPVFQVFKLNDGKYLVKIDLDNCDDKDNDSLIMDYKSKKKETEDELLLSAETEEDVCNLIKKYLPIVKVDKEEDIVKLWNKIKV